MYTQTERILAATKPLGRRGRAADGLVRAGGVLEVVPFRIRPRGRGTHRVRKAAREKGRGIVRAGQGEKRYFNGIVSRISSGTRDERFFYYRVEVVPQVWLLTARSQSRIFQHLTVPDILKTGLRGFESPRVQGHFPAARLSASSTARPTSRSPPADGRGGHLLLLQAHRRRPPDGAGQHAASHPDVPEPRKCFSMRRRGGTRHEDRVRHGRRRRSSDRASTRCGTTASSCPASTWRPRRRSWTACRPGERATS